jgi:pimeloyl-ACP methyl ester carboxylesterase
MIYQDYITGENQYVLAFGGTDDKIWELEFNDWLNNIKQGLGWSAPQYTAAMEIGRAVGRAVGQTRLIVTGHSLGGGLASAAALVAGVRADTFNAAGLHEYTLYERDQNDDPLRNPLGGYIELYPGTAARYAVAGNFIAARYVDHEILNFVQGFIGRTAIGVQREMDGPRDLSLALSVSAFAASVANRNPWGAAAAGLRFFGTMVELHSFPSIFYGLLVTEGSLGSIQIDMLGYSQYF